MKKIKLADVLWRAANRHLEADYYSYSGSGKDQFSCNAVGIALANGVGCYLTQEVRSFLIALGCSGGASELAEISGFDYDKVQGLRYMWLLLAMHVAEDENLYITVDA